MSSKRIESLKKAEEEKKKLTQTIEHYKNNLMEREEALAEKEKVLALLSSPFSLPFHISSLTFQSSPLSHIITVFIFFSPSIPPSPHFLLLSSFLSSLSPIGHS